MSRNLTSIKQQLTDATLIDQNDNIHLDTANNESVTRQKTVRSLRHAVRRIMDDASDEDLFLRTLGGTQINAMKAIAGGAVDAMEYVHAVSGVVTGGSSDFAAIAPDSDIPVHSWKQMINDVTVLYTDGKYYIDDVGTTGLYRPKAPASLKQAFRRVVSETGTAGVYKLNTIAGLLVSQLNDLPVVGGDNISGINSVFTDFDAAATTSATTVVALDSLSASIGENLASTLRQRTTGSSRSVFIDNVGELVTDTTKARVSSARTLYDLMDVDGNTVKTMAGVVTSGLSALFFPTPSALVSQIQHSVTKQLAVE